MPVLANVSVSGSGATGPMGNVYFDSSTGWSTVGTYTVGHTYPTNTVIMNTAPTPQYDGDIVLRRDGKPDIKLGAVLDEIMERLAIIAPAMDLIEKYPVLKDAYENYKTIEALVKNGDDTDE